MHFARFKRESKVADYRTLIPRLRYRKRVQSVLAHALRHAPASGPILEFGVYRGRTIRFLAKLLPDAHLYGFDSFEGFPDDGRRDWKQDFRVDTLPDVPGNVSLVKGFFDKTLPVFLAENPNMGPPRLVHIDCDLYSSTKVVFDHLGSSLGPGSVIVFDELLHYHRFRENEFLAFYQFLEEHQLTFRWLARSGKLMPLERFLSLQAERNLPSSLQNFRVYGYHQHAAVILENRSPDYHGKLDCYFEKAKQLADQYPMELDIVHNTI